MVVTQGLLVPAFAKRSWQDCQKEMGYRLAITGSTKMLSRARSESSCFVWASFLRECFREILCCVVSLLISPPLYMERKAIGLDMNQQSKNQFAIRISSSTIKIHFAIMMF